jgi:hypothetical protein
MGKYQGANSGADGAVDVLPLTSSIGHIVGVTETVVTRPSGARYLTLHMQTEGTAGNSFRIRPGDYKARTFTATSGTDQLNMVAHGLSTGDGPYKVSTTGTLPAPLTNATLYWIYKVDADNVKLALSEANAKTTPLPVVVDLTTNGSGTHTLGGMPAAPAATVTDDYGAFKLVVGAPRTFLAPKSFTVVGTGATDVLSYWWS